MTVAEQGLSLTAGCRQAIREGRKTLIRVVAKAEDASCPVGAPGDRVWVRERRADDPTPPHERRLWLEITDVRRERLQQIADADISAEGEMWRTDAPPGETPREGFARWWTQVHPREGQRWQDDPEVWVVRFRRAITFVANDELALHVPDPAAAERFYVEVLGCAVFTRTRDMIGVSNGALRLYLVRDPECTHDAVVPSFDVQDRAAAIRQLLRAGCTLVPVGPHAPEAYYVRDPFGVVFDVIERNGNDAR